MKSDNMNDDEFVRTTVKAQLGVPDDSSSLDEDVPLLRPSFWFESASFVLRDSRFCLRFFVLRLEAPVAAAI